MRPHDFRDRAFESLQPKLTQQLLDVYDAWQTFGPCTTRELAIRSGIHLLNVRPRTTALVKRGLIELDPTRREGNQGVYRVVQECQVLTTTLEDTNY